jgi:hypothetical protein
MATLHLEFLARQLERVITRLDRIDATMQSLVAEVGAMHSRQ